MHEDEDVTSLPCFSKLTAQEIELQGIQIQTANMATRYCNGLIGLRYVG